MVQVESKQALYPLACFYGLLVFFAFYQAWGLDFSSYYVASAELLAGNNPYHDWLWSDRAWVITYLPCNPNPPITLLIFSFFSYFSYPVAFGLWLGVSYGLALYGVYVSLTCVLSQDELKSKLPMVLLLYICAFPVVMNTGLVQLGSVLLFLVAMGYRAYLKHEAAWAGFWWGLLIALKLFPGLLFVYVLLNRRYRLAAWMFGSCVGFSLLPMFFIGIAPYSSYLERIQHGVNWYGINWNASLFGYLFRLFVEMGYLPYTGGVHHENLIYTSISPTEWVRSVYYYWAGVILINWVWFFRRIEQGAAHRGFAFALILMIVLSPMGWVYYFPMLLIPLLCTFYEGVDSPKRMLWWFLTLFMLYFPVPLTHAISMHALWAKLSLYSIHFYALLSLGGLILTMGPVSNGYRLDSLPAYVKPVFLVITFFSLSFIMIRMLVLMSLK